MRTHAPPGTRRGFTMIELMTVVALVGLLSSLALDVGPGGGSPHATADQLASAMGLARTRAIATRRVHRVQVEAGVVSIWQSTTAGFTAATGWEQVHGETIPTNVRAFNATRTVQTAAGATPKQDDKLLFAIDFRPDGSLATGATVFLAKADQSDPYRVFVYPATGSAHVRPGW
ncbi:MAG TPA: GspH/FimT family pseudopilin [Kofleriaceae bacterium]|nr:GspH/FimT family pseudopilin [Kofleriaceae bacterium]